MDNRKTFLAATFAAIAIAASAMPGERGPTPRGEGAGGRGYHVQQSGTHLPRMQHSGPRRSAFSSPNDSFHDTCTLSTVAVAQSAPAAVEQKSITIVNSNVTINQ